VSFSDRDRLAGILAACNVAESIVADGRDGFLRSDRDQYAATDALSRIGEHAKHLPDELLDRMKAIPWSAAKAMRDKIQHASLDIDHALVWTTIEQRLPVVRVLVGDALDLLDAHGIDQFSDIDEADLPERLAADALSAARQSGLAGRRRGPLVCNFYDRQKMSRPCQNPLAPGDLRCHEHR